MLHVFPVELVVVVLGPGENQQTSQKCCKWESLLIKSINQSIDRDNHHDAPTSALQIAPLRSENLNVSSPNFDSRNYFKRRMKKNWVLVFNLISRFLAHRFNQVRQRVARISFMTVPSSIYWFIDWLIAGLIDWPKFSFQLKRSGTHDFCPEKNLRIPMRKTWARMRCNILGAPTEK